MGVENKTALAFILYMPDLETLTMQQLWQILAISIFSVNDNPWSCSGTSPSQLPLTSAFLGTILLHKLREQESHILSQPVAKIDPAMGWMPSFGEHLVFLVILVLFDLSKLWSKVKSFIFFTSLVRKSIPQHAQPSSIMDGGLMSWQNEFIIVCINCSVGGAGGNKLWLIPVIEFPLSPEPFDLKAATLSLLVFGC